MTVTTEPSDAALLGLNRAATIARLVAGAIHDVNNALMVIAGTIDIIESRPDTPPTLHEALARLRAQSSRAASTLAQVQTFTRAERGASEPLNLREVAEQALALRDFAIRRARLTARLEVEGSAAFVVRGNRGDLQQVLLNLITNAEQALAGRTGAAIVVHLSHEGGMVALSVIDEGGGVSLLPPERAFQAFVTTRDPFESAGLGLWASQLLVERQGGTLRLEPSSNGTIVTMRLPGVMIGR